MTTKERLHQLVDQLPNSKFRDAERLLENLRLGDATEALTAEDIAWLDSDLSDLDTIEPYDWGDNGPPPMNAVHYAPGVGIVVEDPSGDD